MARTVSTAELVDLVGQDLPVSDWFEITQERVNQFADATNDHQFIHVDAEAAARTPFGGTIAHGFLSTSLVSFFQEQTGVIPEGLVMAVNYGSDKIRYLAPVRVGARIRSRNRLLSAKEKEPGQWLVKTGVTIEIEGEETPAMIAEILGLFITR